MRAMVLCEMNVAQVKDPSHKGSDWDAPFSQWLSTTDDGSGPASYPMDDAHQARNNNGLGDGDRIRTG